MKAVVYTGKDIVYKELSKPLPKNNEVLIKVKAVGICGTDVAIAKSKQTIPITLILGHSLSSKKINAKPLISKVFPLEKAKSAFKSHGKNNDHIWTVLTL